MKKATDEELAMKTLPIVCVIALTSWALSAPAHAQEYSPWSPAINLGPIVNSAVNEGCPFIAKSDLTLYVVSTRPDGFGAQDIYVSHRDSVYDAWGPLQNLGSTINSDGNELCPTLTIDGHRLFFVSDRPGGVGKQDLYVSQRHNKRDDFGWETPINLGVAVNSTENDYTPSLLEDEATGRVQLYFSSDRPGGAGNVDIYSSNVTQNGEFEWAVLVLELSTPFIDERPNVRKDGLEMFFNSNRPGSLGATDLWVSTRESAADPWLPPVNLGSTVNTSSGELRPSLSFDGTTLYFHSNRPGSYGSVDIYVTTRRKARTPD
jgi:Tol biopolymer transport system component